MADFSPVTAGQTENLPTHSASWITEVSRVVGQAVQSGKVGNPPPPAHGINPSMLKIKNLTGQDLVRGHVVQLGDSILNETDPGKIWFQGNKPADPVDRWLAIVRKATKHEAENADDIVDAQMIGVTTALVNVTSTSHGYAVAEADNCVLQSATSGPLEILNELSETGEQEVAVLIGAGGGSASAGFGKVTQEITAADLTATPPYLGWGIINPASFLTPVSGIDTEPATEPDDLEIGFDAETDMVIYSTAGEVIPVDTVIQWKTLEPDGKRFVDVVHCESA